MAEQRTLELIRTPSMTRLHQRIAESSADATQILLRHWQSHNELNAIILHDALRELNEIQTDYAWLGPRLDNLYHRLLWLGVQNHMNDVLGDRAELSVTVRSSTSPTPPPPIRTPPAPQLASRGRQWQRLLFHLPLSHRGVRPTRAQDRPLPDTPPHEPEEGESVYFSAASTPTQHSSPSTQTTAHMPYRAVTHPRRRGIPTQHGTRSPRSLPDRPREGACFQCGEVGHWALDCSQYRCYHCERTVPGHYARDCPRPLYLGEDRNYYDWEDNFDETAWANINEEPGFG